MLQVVSYQLLQDIRYSSHSPIVSDQDDKEISNPTLHATKLVCQEMHIPLTVNRIKHSAAMGLVF